MKAIQPIGGPRIECQRLRAYAYIRVSGKAQKEGDGPDRQRDRIAKFCAAHDIELVREFADLGVSGVKHRRRGLTELLAAIRANGVRTVIVERADRLARDVYANQIILRKFRRAGAVVIEADGGNELTSTENPTRILVVNILAAVSQWQKSVGNLNMKAGRDRIRKYGRKDNPNNKRAEGDRPYGALPSKSRADDPDAIAEYEHERETLDMIVGMADSGASAIARELNARGVRSRSGKPWKRQTIERILKRELSRAS